MQAGLQEKSERFRSAAGKIVTVQVRRRQMVIFMRAGGQKLYAIAIAIIQEKITNINQTIKIANFAISS